MIPEDLTTLIGSYWTEIFEDSNKVRSLMDGVAALHSQFEFNRIRLNSAVSAESIEPLQISAWEKLTYTLDENTVIKYDSAGNYTDGLIYNQQDQYRYQFYTGDMTIQSIAFICDNPSNPSVMLTQGIDYVVSNGVVQLQYTIEDYGLTQDSLWGRKIGRDLHDIYRLLGYATRFDGKGTKFTKICFQNFWYMLVYGATWLSLMRFLTAAAGTDCFDTNEIIHLVRDTLWGPVVVTDNRSYFSVEGSTVEWDEQDIVASGDAVANNIEIVHNKTDVFDSSLIPEGLWVDQNSVIVKNDKTAGRHLCIIKSRMLEKTPAEFSLIGYLKEVYPAHGQIYIIADIDVNVSGENEFSSEGYQIGNIDSNGDQAPDNSEYAQLSMVGVETFNFENSTCETIPRIRMTN